MITLNIDGRKMNFSKKELQERPVEGKWFEVNPAGINRNLFAQKRLNPKEERTRVLILKAFMEVDKNPQKYARPFKTMMPPRGQYVAAKLTYYEKLASSQGGHIADLVEQSLEWAQRITNGEKWGTLCQKPDTALYNRIIVCENGYFRRVGGASMVPYRDSATYVSQNCYDADMVSCMKYVIPLIATYK